MKSITVILFAIASAGFAASANAQDPKWTLEGYAGVVSDYRYRGLSLSGGDPSLQLGATASHSSGFYASADLASIEEYGVGVDGDGAELEATLTSGWAGDLVGLDVDVALAWFAYPDGDEVNYFETPVTFAWSNGDIAWQAGIAYAPEQDALGGDDNRYLWAGYRYAPTAWPIGLTGTIGREEGAYAPDGKTDWTIGLESVRGRVVLALAYVDSDRDEERVVASAFLNF